MPAASRTAPGSPRPPALSPHCQRLLREAVCGGEPSPDSPSPGTGSFDRARTMPPRSGGRAVRAGRAQLNLALGAHRVRRRPGRSMNAPRRAPRIRGAAVGLVAAAPRIFGE